jgi:NDP-4-keto-2,6-dideoxyhexose 3-C-methyltransferase
MYGENYGYRSGLNGSMVRHLNSKVHNILKRVDLAKGDLVIDIGSNDSTTLRAYPDMGLELIGIDPSAAKFKSFYPSDVKLVVDFFSAKKIREVVPTKKAKVITSIAMFYDLEEPEKFLTDLSSVMDDDGLLVMQMSYTPLMINQMAFDMPFDWTRARCKPPSPGILGDWESGYSANPSFRPSTTFNALWNHFKS